jgi:hypothetical protein
MSKPEEVKKAFEAGKKAEEQGKSSKCPDRYDKRPDERKAWFDGYYQNYLVRRHKSTFEKYGIKFP